MILQHRAIQGRWNEGLQRINDAAIMNADVIVVLTPRDVPAEGTAREVKLAKRFNIPVITAPPGSDRNLSTLVESCLEEAR